MMIYLFNIKPMTNVIDDQERFRKIQAELFQQFEMDLLDQSLPLSDHDIEKNILSYILEQIKRDVSMRLNRIETVCNFRIHFSKAESSVTALQLFYDLMRDIDDEFKNQLITIENEKKKKNPPLPESSQE